MIIEWPEIGTQDIKDVKLGLGMIDISQKNLDRYTTRKWILAETKYSDDEIIEINQSSVFNHFYKLFATSTGSSLKHEDIQYVLRVADKIGDIRGGGDLEKNKGEEVISLSGKSGDFGKVPKIVTAQLQKMVREAWVPGQKLDNLDHQPETSIEPSFLVDPLKEPFEYYDGDVNLYWLRFSQVLQACRKLYEDHLSDLERLEKKYSGVVSARKAHNHKS